jgi:iron complex outermembrane recepter protein
MPSSVRLSFLKACLLFQIVTVAAPIVASGEAGGYDFNLPAQALADSLRAVGSRASVNVAFEPSAVREKRAPALQGSYSVQEALARLLAGTGLSVRMTQGGSFVVGSDAKPLSSTNEVIDARRRLEFAQSEYQQGGPGQEQESTDSQGKLDEIVVTATKREERLSDVAASVSAISRQEIERRGLTSMDDYMRGIPGVSRLEIGAGRHNPIVIRGLSLFPDVDKASVGTYFGEVPLESSLGGALLGGDWFGSADVALVDVRQVEVLKGPQGTLYGSGSLAGVVRNRPVEPNLQRFESRVTAGFSRTARNGGSNHLGNAVLNLPLVDDRLALRLIGYRYSDSGYVKNVAATGGAGLPVYVDIAGSFGGINIDEDHIGEVERDGGRATILWKPNDAFSASYTFVRQLTEQTGMPEVHLGLAPYEQGFTQLDETAPRGMGQDTALTINNFGLEYELSWGQLMSSSSHIKADSRFAREVTNALSVPLDQVTTGEFEELAHEVRLTSRLNGAFQFLLGGFYEDSEAGTFSTNRWSGAADLFPFAQGTEVLPLFAEVPDDRGVQQKALFGEVSYELVKGLRATVGARQFSYDSDNAVYDLFLPAFGATARGGLVNVLRSSESGNVGKVGLSYKASADTLLYAQWSQGFRLGSPLQRPNVICDPDGNGRIEITLPDGRTFVSSTRVDSDRTDNFELGGKFSWLEDRARLSASVYRINWDKIPLTLVDVNTGCGTTVNAGEAFSQGIEVETQLRSGTGLDFRVGLSYLQAEIAEDATGVSEGDRLPGSPRFSANAAVNYDFPFRGHATYLRADVLYVGEYYNNLQQLGAAAGGYHQINLRSGIAVGPVSFDIYANNVTNSDDLTWVYAAISADRRAFRLRPRTVGVQLAWTF